MIRLSVLLLTAAGMVVLSSQELRDMGEKESLLKRVLELLDEQEPDTDQSDAIVSTQPRAVTERCSPRTIELRDGQGSISSPGYSKGQRYPERIDCRWRIVAPNPTDKILLEFSEPFGIERSIRCLYDSLSIYAGKGPDAPLYGRFCNSNPPRQTILIPSNFAYVRFISDFSDTSRGFTFKYSIAGRKDEEAAGCGPGVKTISKTSGSITSPNYPNNYTNNVLCKWLISVPKTQKVRLEFEDFQVEEVLECLYDNLTIYDGSSPSAKTLGVYCGTKHPQNIVASGNQVFIIFKTDDSVKDRGFEINFKGIGGVPTPAVNATTPPVETSQVDMTCNFEQGTMCKWRPATSGAISWRLIEARRYQFRISNGDAWGGKDHTTNSPTGHYIVIDGRIKARPGYKGNLVSPTLTAGPKGGRCLRLWYNMHFTKGTLKVIMKRKGQSDEVIWQRDGDQGNGWHRAKISLVSDAPYTLVVEGSRGSYSTETGIALDDIIFSDTPCLAVPLDCGRRDTNRTKRILGGKLSAEGEWPWIVFVRTEVPESGGQRVYRCGGSLIASRWVLTASHCFEHEDTWLTDPKAITLVFGEQNLDKWNDPQFSIRPEKLIIHPQRKKSSIGEVAPYDVALIKLPHAIHPSSHVNVVCLPPADDELPLSAECYVGGWGITDTGQDSSVLKHVDMKVIQLRQCFKYFGRSITKDLICATHASAGKSTCRGDSGGPLVCREGDHFFQAGVVSFGVPCHLRERAVPSVFARVSFYLPWIETTINENS